MNLTFDIEPGGAPLGVVALQVVNSALDLASGVPALVAGEKVHIDVLHATIPSIVDGVRGVRIRTSQKNREKLGGVRPTRRSKRENGKK